MNMQKYGSAEITVQKRSNEEIHTIIWTVPEFLRFNLDNKTCKITPNIMETTPKTFQLNMEVHYSSFNINYISAIPVKLKSVALKMFTFDLQNWTHSERKDTVIKKEHLMVNANSWENLGKLDKSNNDMGLFTYLDEQKFCLLSEGNLRLTVEFVVTTKNNIKKFNIPDSQLINDLRKLYHEGINSDVVMRSEDGKEFKVHKAVLACRSEVLKAHFEHKTKESTTNIVKSPVKSDVLREVLSFIYTDKSDVDISPEKMLAAADFYQLTRLKSICEKALFEKLSVENAIETLQLADLYSANDLKKLTLEFIKRDDNQRKLIYKTAGWANLKSVDLIKIISE